MRLLLATLIGCAGGQMAAAGVQFESGPKAVPTVELFSSEGCSSCPPADRWFGSLKSDPGLWKQFIPIVFHVDYWDQLGWKDALATKEFTERQRAYAKVWGHDSVYTPGVVLSGAEWTVWRNAKAPPSGASKTVGNLKLVQLASGKYQVFFRPSGPALKDPRIFIALLGMGVQHNIGAGENQGVKLNHDFVVLQLKSQAAKSDSGSLNATIEVENKEVKADRLAVVGWIAEGNGPRPIQAAGGYLERNLKTEEK